MKENTCRKQKNLPKQFYKVWNSVLKTHELEIYQLTCDASCHPENKKDKFKKWNESLLSNEIKWQKKKTTCEQIWVEIDQKWLREKA